MGKLTVKFVEGVKATDKKAATATAKPWNFTSNRP